MLPNIQSNVNIWHAYGSCQMLQVSRTTGLWRTLSPSIATVGGIFKLFLQGADWDIVLHELGSTSH